MRVGRLAAVLAAVAIGALLAAAPAAASYPAGNGRLGYIQDGDIWTINPDGTGATNLTSTAATEACASWAPGGAKLSFTRGNDGPWVADADGTDAYRLNTRPPGLGYDLSGCAEDWFPDATKVTFTFDDHCDAGGVYDAHLDGSPPDQLACGPPVCGHDTTPEGPDWSPDGTDLALVGCQLIGEGDLWTVGEGGFHQLTDTVPLEQCPDYSPDGTSIAYVESDFWENKFINVYRIDADGTDRTPVTTSGYSGCPRWAPDGSKFTFDRAGVIWSADPDGSGLTQLTTPASTPFWSPDAEKILFSSNRDGPYDLYTMNRDGTGVARVTNSSAIEVPFGWQALPKGYPRPKGATPFSVSLSTAYAQCTSPDRTHGPPLAFSSCSAPQPASQYLTVGTGDSNGMPARNEGYLRLDATLGNPATPTDEADVAIRLFMDDVFTKALADYTGELRAHVALRITDRLNTPYPGGAGPGTTIEIPLDVVAACTAVPDPQEGSSCATTTTGDALAPGLVQETRRTMWQLGRVEIYDGGADGDANTPAGDTLFATQGIFIP